MNITAVRTPIFKLYGDLVDFIVRAIPHVPEKSIIVVTSKIVALAQGRVVPNTRGAKVRWIKKESSQHIKTKWCYLTLKDGHWCPNAGIDESNARGELILWPTASQAAAQKLHGDLRKHYGRRNLGVLFTDSRIFPLRAGVTGVALGYAGFKGLRSYIGKPDIFGRKLKLTRTNIADSLASAAVLVMGEGREQQPLALVTDAPVEFTRVPQGKKKDEQLRIDPRDDLYRPLFEGLTRKDKRPMPTTKQARSTKRTSKK